MSIFCQGYPATNESVFPKTYEQIKKALKNINSSIKVSVRPVLLPDSVQIIMLHHFINNG